MLSDMCWLYLTMALQKALYGVTAFAIIVFLYSYANVYTGFRFPYVASTRRPAVLGDLTNLVIVFIGTTGSGHGFPGATLPHGMVKVGMDTDSPGNVSSGDSLTHSDMLIMNSYNLQ